MRRNSCISGFTLVELSVVLIILGLLVGGILGGQSLIHAAQLRAISTEYNQWQTAINTFRTQYFAYPGDMSTATRFWDDAGVCDSVEDENRTTPLPSGTCNGDGNGIVFTSAGDRYERYLLWQHLQLAGLIPGNYSGVRGPRWVFESVPGVNAPASKFGSAVWHTSYSESHFDTSHLFARDYSNALVIESLEDLTWGNLLTPEEAWSIDAKLDDGKPSTGIIISNRSDGNCTDGSSPTDSDALYQLGESGAVCSLYFLHH